MASNDDADSSTGLLKNISSPEILRELSISELPDLAGEIREELVRVISHNGGHLAPNLGVVELTIALHYVFNTPNDKLVWDVGHQAYVHKLLTGRQEQFKTLRQHEGCLGFLSRNESDYDVFGAGHAGTAISAALGIAAARDRRGGDEKVVAVVGDGSLNCGISLEGLNNTAEVTKNLIVVLNDNKMSISPNVGAIPRCLNRIISGRSYNRFKAFTKMMLKGIPHWQEFFRGISRLEEAAKSLFVPGVFFEELGFRYIGPINGHDFPELVRTLEGIKEFKLPVILHVLTEKGKGYGHAEAAPEKFHGLSSFNPDTGKKLGGNNMTFSLGFGRAVCQLAELHPEVVSITAAMSSGTGLTEFEEKFPERFYDVGIAEEHAVVFAAGLATDGIKPVVAVYATFLQRALDYVFHDICLQNLPVIICADRSGIVEDGPTHHGIHDLSFLRNLPNLTIMSPKDEAELKDMLFAAYEQEGPVIIRYPRGESGGDTNLDNPAKEIPWGKAQVIKKGKDLAIWTCGRECKTAKQVGDLLKKEGLSVTLVNTRFLKPFDSKLLCKQASKMPIVTIEDCQIKGGLGSTVDEILIGCQHQEVLHFGWGEEIVPHGEPEMLRQKAGLTVEAIATKCLEKLAKKPG